MTDKQIIDLTEIDQKYKDKCSLIKAGKCKNVNIFIEQSRKLKAKEQECEEFRKANDEKNELLAKLGCPTIATARRKVFCLQEQLEAYKMEAEEGKEINAELKAENEELKKDVIEALKLVEITSTHNTFQETKINRLSKTLTEIKEIAEDFYLDSEHVKDKYLAQDILQKISEVLE